VGARRLGRPLLIAIALSSPAAANPATKRARVLYKQGAAAYHAGKYDEALEAFRRAYVLKHDSALLFDIAQCVRKLHGPDDPQSIEAYTEYVQSLHETGYCWPDKPSPT
jgi:hypothetical protein